MTGNRSQRRSEASNLRHLRSKSSRTQPTTGWAQSTLFWGAIGVSSGLFGTVFAVAIGVAWLLVPAWIFFMLSAWEYLRLSNTSRPKIIFGAVGILSAALLAALSVHISPAKEPNNAFVGNPSANNQIALSVAQNEAAAIAHEFRTADPCGSSGVTRSTFSNITVSHVGTETTAPVEMNGSNCNTFNNVRIEGSPLGIQMNDSHANTFNNFSFQRNVVAGPPAYSANSGGLTPPSNVQLPNR